jgi:hypothetical protein
VARAVSRLLDQLSEFLAARRGLPTLIGIGLVVLNYCLQFVPGLEGFAQTNTLLHAGVVLALFGLLLAQALG